MIPIKIHEKRQTLSGTCAIYNLANMTLDGNIYDYELEDRYVPCSLELCNEILKKEGYPYYLSSVVNIPIGRIPSSFIQQIIFSDWFQIAEEKQQTNNIIFFELMVYIGEHDTPIIDTRFHSVHVVRNQKDKLYYSDPRNNGWQEMSFNEILQNFLFCKEISMFCRKVDEGEEFITFYGDKLGFPELVK